MGKSVPPPGVDPGLRLRWEGFLRGHVPCSGFRSLSSWSPAAQPAQWRYASIHFAPFGGGIGSRRSRIETARRYRPRQQMATIWARPVKSMSSTVTSTPRTCVWNGTARFSTSIVCRPATCSSSSWARSITRPSCPRCDRVVALSKLHDGQRICRTCFARTAAVPCARCGAVREPATRDATGRPQCPNCLSNDPINLEDCVGCRRRRRVAARTADGPWCQSCRPRPRLTCGMCGRSGPCEVSRASGQPWCDSCQSWWARCSRCGTVASIRGGTRAQPLCARCVNPDPSFWDRCPVCRQTWQLSPHRACHRCTLAQRVDDLLAGRDGHVRADLTPLRHALTGVPRPVTAMAWLSRPAVTRLLTEVAADHRPLAHDVLDELPASKTLDHLRAVLIAGGTLPARDERLVTLERWVTDTIATRADPAERQLLHRYAVWHHLRRLRRRLGTAHASHLQALNVRCHTTAAVKFLDWLTARNLTLATCTQPDLDQWAARADVSYRDETSHFIRWATANRQATRLSFGARRWHGPRGPHDTEARWATARRLLHDDTIATPDRVAGLLLLLYAQRLSTISTLTTDHITTSNEQVHLRLGSAATLLPEPLAAL